MKKFIAIISSLLLLTSTLPVNAYYTNMNASVVIGQQDFASNSLNQGMGISSPTSQTFQRPYHVSTDGQHLAIADRLNHRVLIWNSIPTQNNTPADVVIGQADFTHNSANQGGTAGANTLSAPLGVFIDRYQRLFVGEAGNHRVLMWNTIPTRNNTPADVVIGQPDMSTTSIGITASKFNSCDGVFVDPSSGKLFISDLSNNRILIFNQVPNVNGASADIVIGQADFTHNQANQGGTVNANTLSDAETMIIANDKLLISDTGNRRTLIFNSIPTANNASADVVIGQADFTHNSANQGGSIAANTISSTVALAYDGKRLYVGDHGNNRLLIFNQIPTQNNQSADLVIGQADFTHGSANQGGNPGANTFNTPVSLTIAQDKVILSDNLNHRALIFNNILSTPLMNINSPISQPEGKIRIAGNISLGERPNYSMQKVTAKINGDGENNVTYLDGGRDNGPGNTLYEFYNDFNPTINLGNSENYTIAFRAQSFNADEDKRFYFTPFSLDKVTVENKPTISFTVNQTFRDQLRNNLSKYQIWIKKDKEKNFKLYVDNIDVNSEYNGNITLKSKTRLLPGTYQFQVRAINTMGREQQSNNLNIKIKK